jgi:hypothetical protein
MCLRCRALQVAPSLPWIGSAPPCYPASSQLAGHRECRSYGATSGEQELVPQGGRQPIEGIGPCVTPLRMRSESTAQCRRGCTGPWCWSRPVTARSHTILDVALATPGISRDRVSSRQWSQSPFSSGLASGSTGYKELPCVAFWIEFEGLGQRLLSPKLESTMCLLRKPPSGLLCTR